MVEFDYFQIKEDKCSLFFLFVALITGIIGGAIMPAATVKIFKKLIKLSENVNFNFKIKI
jgi:hypothetical protein